MSDVSRDSCSSLQKTQHQMKKIILAISALMMTITVSAQVPAYKVVQAKQVDMSRFPTDGKGYTTIFNGKDFTGWRGYGKNYVPQRWTIDDGCIKINGSGTGEGQSAEGGDIIFAHQFKNFTVELEWKVAKGSNSGIFYLAQEVTTKDDKGNDRYEPIYISCPEYQILDNVNHPDAMLGVDGNRKSASLYDMIPAKPQNAKPYGEWNTAKIVCYKGTIIHYQNGKKVLEYHLWTPQWTDMLQASKFSEKAWPLAFELLNNCGGAEHKGYFGLQDHGDDVWYRNIRIKDMDNADGIDIEQPEIAFQMYSVRDLIGSPEQYAKNHKDVLAKLAKMGYTSTEAAYYDDGRLYGVTPEQYKADIEAAGMKVLSSHAGHNLSDKELASGKFNDALKWWRQCIDAHKKAGMKYIVMPDVNRPKTLAEAKVICNYMNAVGEMVNKAGMKFGYHSHAHEFEKVEDQVWYDYMLRNTDPAKVFFQMDVYWAVIGNVGPVEYFKKYPGRFTMLHIKDHKELGQSGMMGFDAIFNNLDTAGTQEIVVEMEESAAPDILEGMRQSINYLLDNDFVK